MIVMFIILLFWISQVGYHDCFVLYLHMDWRLYTALEDNYHLVFTLGSIEVLSRTRDKPVLHNQSDGASLCCMNISHRDLIIIDCHKNSHSLHLLKYRPKSV